MIFFSFFMALAPKSLSYADFFSFFMTLAPKSLSYDDFFLLSLWL